MTARPAVESSRATSTARRAAPWILAAFGLLWAAFAIISEWGNLGAMLVELAAVPAVFVLLALLARRWARAAGLLSIAAAVGAFFFFSVYDIFAGDPGALVVAVLVPLPLLVVGVILIASK